MEMLSHTANELPAIRPIEAVLMPQRTPTRAVIPPAFPWHGAALETYVMLQIRGASPEHAVPVKAPELAHFLGRHPSTVYRALSRMANVGYLAIERRQGVRWARLFVVQQEAQRGERKEASA